MNPNCDEEFMRLALDEALLAAKEDEVPIGAVIVCENRVIARNHNRKEQRCDPTAHAEILVLQQAAQLFPSWRVENSTLYVTLEPCPMCAGAILQARLDRVVFGTPDPKAGAVVSLYSLLNDARLNHRCDVVPNVLQKECVDVLKDFFQQKRSRKNFSLEKK